MSKPKKHRKPAAPKGKRKQPAAEKQAKRERNRTSMVIFIQGRQVRVPRPQLIDGLDVDEFIARNAAGWLGSER